MTKTDTEKNSFGKLFYCNSILPSNAGLFEGLLIADDAEAMSQYIIFGQLLIILIIIPHLLLQGVVPVFSMKVVCLDYQLWAILRQSDDHA